MTYHYERGPCFLEKKQLVGGGVNNVDQDRHIYHNIGWF